jgi:hypothetical protein
MEAYDYLVLLLTLTVSIFIGLYYAFEAKCRFMKKCNKKMDERSNTEETQMAQYLTAGGSMHFIPLAFSILASNFSASGMLGYPGKPMKI